jgi:acetyl-CoA carboxylase carboxyltransferase component
VSVRVMHRPLEPAARAGPLSPAERLEQLCDPGTVRPIRSAVASRSALRQRPGDGVLGAAGAIAGRPVFCYAEDASFAGGSLGEAHADTIVRVLRLARESGTPVIGFVESAGARMDEGAAALAGYGRIFREHVAAAGWIPQLSVITGTAAGGASYSPALTDFVVMTAAASMFLTGPAVVEQVMGERVSREDLGGPRVHSANGVCDLVAGSDAEAIELTRELLAHLPQNAGEAPPVEVAQFPVSGDPSEVVPAEQRRVYDMREVIRRLGDGGRLLELAPRWARNMVTTLTRIEGRPVGVIANQPRHLGGVIDCAAAQKAARFVDACDRFGLPLVVLCDTPGFLPGTRQEAQGVIRHGAGLLRAFAAASVPKVTVVMRKAYGGGFITMNSKDLGADLVFAWPQAEIGVVGPTQAVGIIHRRRIEAAAHPHGERERLAAAYAEEHLTASAAAACGHVDELVDPAETRARLGWALAMLGSRRRNRR